MRIKDKEECVLVRASGSRTKEESVLKHTTGSRTEGVVRVGAHHRPIGAHQHALLLVLDPHLRGTSSFKNLNLNLNFEKFRIT